MAVRKQKLSKVLFIAFCWLILGILGGCQQGKNEQQLQQIAYLGWDEANQKQIFLTDQSGRLPRQLTTAVQEVISFAVAPNGGQIAYIVQTEDGSELWLLRLNGRFLSTRPKLILTCPNAICSQPVWAVDGRRLIYEKRPLLNKNGDRGSPSLWWLDTETGKSIPLEERSDSPIQGAQFSPDGKWISYVSAANEGIVIYNFENGRTLIIPSLIGSPAAWNPASSQIIVANFNNTIQHGEEGDDHQSHSHDASPAINLFVTDVASETRTLLTKATGVDDGTAVTSPTGEWIAFGRKLNQTATGRQLWLIRPDGSDAHAVTDDLLVNHGGIGWSENGRLLLYQRFDSGNKAAVDTRPSIHTIDINSGEVIDIAPAGFHPTWIPSS